MQVPGGESVKLQVGSPVTFDCKYADDAEIEPHVPRDLASHLLKVLLPNPQPGTWNPKPYGLNLNA
jgi:hypothetical protein